MWNSKKLVLACLLSEYLHNFKFTWGSSTLLLAAAFWRSRGDPELLSETSQNLWTPLQTGMHKFWLYHLHLWQRAFEPSLTSNSLVCLRTQCEVCSILVGLFWLFSSKAFFSCDLLVNWVLILIAWNIWLYSHSWSWFREMKLLEVMYVVLFVVYIS